MFGLERVGLWIRVCAAAYVGAQWPVHNPITYTNVQGGLKLYYYCNIIPDELALAQPHVALQQIAHLFTRSVNMFLQRIFGGKCYFIW